MNPLYRPDAPKRPVNLSINSDLLEKSRAMKLNLSAVLEKRLCEELGRQENARWRSMHTLAIRAYNEDVDENGCFGDEDRTF